MTARLGRREAKALIWGGIIWIPLASWLLYTYTGNPLDDLSLIRHAQVSQGHLVDEFEHEESGPGDRGVYVSDVGVYAFHTPDGREYKTKTRVPTGTLRGVESVEYLPSDPSVSRIKGDGCQTIAEWMWRKAGIGAALLAGVVVVGVGMLRRGLAALRPV